MNNAELYSMITEKIIANLETAGSWRRMWNLPSPVSLNGHIYQGINRLLLSADPYSSRVYGTFKQIRQNGGAVKKGEHGSIIVFWSGKKKIDPDSGEEKTVFLLKYYYVFNSEQADFDEEGRTKISRMNAGIADHHHETFTQAENIIAGYPNPPRFIFSDKDDQAYYSPALDLVSVPQEKYFQSSSAFFKVIYHEMAHSTGHPSRLNRCDGMMNRFGDELYSKEELVAELCASFLASVAGIDADIRNSAAYIKGWASHLRENTRWILWAAARAEKAADFILARDSENDRHTGKLFPEKESVITRVEQIIAI